MSHVVLVFEEYVIVLSFAVHYLRPLARTHRNKLAMANMFLAESLKVFRSISAPKIEARSWQQ
jgi:hypothetical protein